MGSDMLTAVPESRMIEAVPLATIEAAPVPQGMVVELVSNDTSPQTHSSLICRDAAEVASKSTRSEDNAQCIQLRRPKGQMERVFDECADLESDPDFDDFSIGVCS